MDDVGQGKDFYMKPENDSPDAVSGNKSVFLLAKCAFVKKLTN